MRRGDPRGGYRRVHQPRGRGGIVERARRRRDVLAGLHRGEEAQLVLDDRAANGSAQLTAHERRRTQERGVAPHLLVAVIHKRGALELIRARLRHGIHQRTGEIALAYVVRRDQYLEFLDGVERQRAAANLRADRRRGAEAEAVGERDTVDLDVVEAVVLAGGRDTAILRHVHLRRVPNQVGHVAVERGQATHQRIGDDRLDTLTGGREVGGGGRCLGTNGGQLRGLLAQLEVEARGLREAHHDVGARLRRKADPTRRHRVRANFKIRNVEAPVVAGDLTGLRAIGAIDHFNRHVCHRGIFFVGHEAGDRTRRGSLSREGLRETDAERHGRDGEAEPTLNSHKRCSVSVCGGIVPRRQLPVPRRRCRKLGWPEHTGNQRL